MPLRILIIGILFCLGGLSAIWDVLSSLFRSHINLNFAVLLLPVGIGLLRGRPSSQWWARFWIILGYIMCIAMVVLVISSPANAHASWFGRRIEGPSAVPYAIVVATLAALFLFALHKLLYSPKATAYFENNAAEPGD